MQNKMILLVEDNPDDQVLTLRALRKNKVINEVVVAHDGAEAIDFLFGEGAYSGRDTSKQPEIILLDLNLPKINGIKVLERIRGDQRTRLLPVVILTTSNEEQDLIASYNLGVNSYIRKPVDFGQFVEAVQQLSTYWLVLNVTAPQQRLSQC